MNDFLMEIPKKTPSFFKKEKGASMVEYAVMLALITIVSLAVITSLGGSVSTVFNTMNSSLASANG
jgi:pilus assembly protein Flp/PilA